MLVVLYPCRALASENAPKVLREEQKHLPNVDLVLAIARGNPMSEREELIKLAWILQWRRALITQGSAVDNHRRPDFEDAS